MLEYSDRSLVLDVLGDYATSKMERNVGGEGEVICVRKDTPEVKLKAIRECLAMIGHKVIMVLGVEENMLHIKQVCMGRIYTIMLLVRALDDEPEFGIRATEKYGALLYAMSDHRPVLFVEGDTSFVMVWSDRAAAQTVMINLVNAGVLRSCRFSDILWGEEEAYPRTSVDHINTNCPLCGAKANFPTGFMFGGGDGATLKCPTCNQTFGVRQLIW